VAYSQTQGRRLRTTGNTLQRVLTPISNDDRTIWIRSLGRKRCQDQ